VGVQVPPPAPVSPMDDRWPDQDEKFSALALPKD
jgi:hypothetical protein